MKHAPNAKILIDRCGRYFAMTCRPLAINFPIRINNQTYWNTKAELRAILEITGYNTDTQESSE